MSVLPEILNLSPIACDPWMERVTGLGVADNLCGEHRGVDPLSLRAEHLFSATQLDEVSQNRE